MSSTPRIRSRSRLLLLAAAFACTDIPTQVTPAPATQVSEAKVSNGTVSTRWNRRVAGLLALRPPTNGQAATNRILAYLSIAQYRAVLAASAANEKSARVSVRAAVGAASVAVLSGFFPLDSDSLEAQLDADIAADQSPAEQQKDQVAGEAIGRSVGAAVNALVATDNYLLTAPGTPPLGAGYWTSSTSPTVRALHGARPFFMTSPSQLRPAPPPAFGSPAFLAALAEIRTISDTRTPEQDAIAKAWNTSVPPFTLGALNLIVDSLIDRHHRTEREAARILAYANAAAFDAHIACFEAKFTYWFIRPSQADPAIVMPIGLPNHPSYPSGHSCITSAMAEVVSNALPSERRTMDRITELSGLSRMFGGIHYRFDIEAGQEIGRGAAALALAGSLK